MNIDVVFLPSDIRKNDLSETVCIVLDIFRATTCIVTAMGNGCAEIFPVLSVEEARQVARREGPVLLAGERRSIKIDGFDCGNSPFEFSADKVRSQKIVMTTSNGTVAINATKGSCRTLIGSFLNAGAVCDKAGQLGKDVLIVCAGTDRYFSLEDAFCAGLLVQRLSGANHADLTDAARGALLMYTAAAGSIAEIVSHSRNGARLYDLALQADVDYCLQTDIAGHVPEYRNGKILFQ
jgi:2-phosphosulfolactate phosphatase